MLKTLYFKSRNEARESVKNGWGEKVIDNGADSPDGHRWATVIEVDEPGTHSISMSEVQTLKQTLSRIWKEEASEKASKAANASPVVNRDNSRILVSRNKREGKYRARLWNNFAKSVECALKAVKEAGCTLQEDFAKEHS